MVDIIQAILSSAVLTTLIAYIAQNRELVANNIAKTRIETDNTCIMKESLEILYDDKFKNEEKKLEQIPKIKRCLNPYYYHDFNLDSGIPISLNNEDVEHDVLIWYVIKKIEYCDENNKEEDKEKYMKVLPSLIAASIKFDWDRYQSETSNKYKKDYKYNYYVAVKKICVSNGISEDFKFAPYKPECDINKLRHYIIIVLPIISYLFFKCSTHRCWFIISCIVIILLGVCGIIIASTALYQEEQNVKVKQSVDDNKSLKMMHRTNKKQTSNEKQYEKSERLSAEEDKIDIECVKNESNEIQEYFARKKDYKWIDLFILIFYCLIILQVFWQIIASNIMAQNCLKNCVKTIIEILKKII